MAKIPLGELLQPFAVTAHSACSAEKGWNVPADLICGAVRNLRDARHDVSAEAFNQITSVAHNFALSRSIESFQGQPGRETQLLAYLRDGGDAHMILDAMAPEFVIELAKYLHADDSEWVLAPYDQPSDDLLGRVRTAAAAFLQNYQPTVGRRPDINLEIAVRALVDVFTPIIGHAPKVTGNKNNGGTGPSPGCLGAHAIQTVLRGVDPTLYPSAVMNMINKVKRQAEPIHDPLLVLLRANPINAFDASLLPGRHEAIAPLRNDPVNGFA